MDFALELKRKYDVGMHLFAATPSYGTKLYEECKAKGYLPADLVVEQFCTGKTSQRHAADNHQRVHPLRSQGNRG